MGECRGEFPVGLMCRVLSVSRSGFYAWLNREPSAQAARRETVGAALEQTYYRCKRRYGAPRLTRETVQKEDRQRRTNPTLYNLLILFLPFSEAEIRPIRFW